MQTRYPIISWMLKLPELVIFTTIYFIREISFYNCIQACLSLEQLKSRFIFHASDYAPFCVYAAEHLSFGIITEILCVDNCTRARLKHSHAHDESASVKLGKTWWPPATQLIPRAKPDAFRTHLYKARRRKAGNPLPSCQVRVAQKLALSQIYALETLGKSVFPHLQTQKPTESAVRFAQKKFSFQYEKFITRGDAINIFASAPSNLQHIMCACWRCSGVYIRMKK